MMSMNSESKHYEMHEIAAIVSDWYNLTQPFFRWYMKHESSSLLSWSCTRIKLIRPEAVIDISSILWCKRSDFLILHYLLCFVCEVSADFSVITFRNTLNNESLFVSARWPEPVGGDGCSQTQACGGCSLLRQDLHTRKQRQHGTARWNQEVGRRWTSGPLHQRQRIPRLLWSKELQYTVLTWLEHETTTFAQHNKVLVHCN